MILVSISDMIVEIYIEIDVYLAISQNLQAFLRIYILNFQVHNKQPANLSEIKTQVELKEKHRAIEDRVESKIRQIIE